MENYEGINPVENTTEANLEEKSVEICVNCGTPLVENQAFCPKCGTPRMRKNVCSKCGAELQDGQEFCSRCGQKVGMEVDFSDGDKKKSSKKKILAIIAAIVVIAIIIVVIVLRGPSVEEVALAEDSIEIKVDDSQSIGYTISPEEASDTEVTWSSSNESVAKVDKDGKITGKGDGVCTITITAGEKTDTVTVTVKSGPDFQQIYDEYCNYSWASVGSDGSYLSIDTNPNDVEDYSDYDALIAIFAVNDALGLPESLENSMLSTTALMGRQSETYSDQGVTVSWSYHPNNGMEVCYTAID